MRHWQKYIFCVFLSSFFVFLKADGVCPQEMEKDVHEALYLENEYPSAADCKSCHPYHYKEWSVSPHAYAVVSPINNAVQAKITQLTNGTNGDFCMRCHTPVGMDMKEPVFAAFEDRHPTSREGISCIVCHRRNKAYGKVSARFSVIKGDLSQPVFGPHEGDELQRVVTSGEFDVITNPKQKGRLIHKEAHQFFQMVESGFCGSCHDVNHFNGFRLEEAFSEYKASPAARKGVSCQDCHMSKDVGVPSGFFHEPIAIVGGKPTKARKRTNHMFIGPDYSVVHPAVFPHNPTAANLAGLSDWLKFNFTEGWGTDDFEDNVSEDYKFPERWADVGDRYEAREVLQENLDLLEVAAEERKKLLKVGYRLGDIVVDQSTDSGVAFRVQVKNGTDGHNVPTGFDAERMVFLQVTVKDKNGEIVFRSGDLDPNGDVRDAHSVYVRNGQLPMDKHLFSLQSKFLVRMVHGGEREQILPVNYSESPLPFIRPPTRSTLLLGRPRDARKHRKTIPPYGEKWAEYKVDQKKLESSEGPYQANIKLIAGMVPVNLVYEVQSVGFDYGMSPRDVADALVAGHQVLWEKDVVLQTGRIESDQADIKY